MFPDTAYGHMHVNAQGTLRIQGVQREDAGFLVCSALSVAGSSSVRAFLQVRNAQREVSSLTFWFPQVTSVADLPPPIVQIGPANQTLPLNSIATLPCQASSPEGEQPRIKWQKDGRPLQLASQPRYTVKPGGTLEIDSKYSTALKAHDNRAHSPRSPVFIRVITSKKRKLFIHSALLFDISTY